MLYNMVRNSATGPVYMPERELSALDTYNRRDERIVTKRPLDILRLADIDSDLGPYRDILHLVLIRDPRDLVSSKHSSVPNQFFQGYDYQFLVRPTVKSFTGPGIAAVSEAIDRAQADGRRILVVRYEDLLRDPEQVRRTIAFATGFPLTRPFGSFHSGDIPDDLSVQLNGVRPVDAPDHPAWTERERYMRARRQLELFPEMEELAVRWGYPPTEDVRRTYHLPEAPSAPQRGTIVAFHTDDAFYTKEAARCRKRLEQLGLPHDFTSVPKNGSWVENCARKPEFLLDVRQRLRGRLLYIDVDAFVHRDPWPYLADYDGDVAAYIHGDGKLWSGTILLQDTTSTVLLLHDWLERQKKAPNSYDQIVLQNAIEDDESGQKSYRFQRLPLELTFIPDREYPYVYGKALIEHLQASRMSKHGRRGDAMTSRIKKLEEITKAHGIE
ncbi:putative nucleotide-diphospho-sugar transferase [Spiribacter sp. 221]|uniref:putative nucleotide-diphospho-sugar transferase n=1 Tax=Spiribacter onubensis TaxID=3122420 RepID=UPI00349F6856